MGDDEKKPKNELAFLLGGVRRTFLRDARAIALGACIGVVLGFLGAYFLGVSAQSGIKFGALVGAFVGLSARSHMSRLFDYDRHPAGRDPES